MKPFYIGGSCNGSAGHLPVINYFTRRIIILRGCPLELNILGSRLAGHVHLLENLGLTGMPHWQTSSVSSSGTYRSKVQGGAIDDIYPTRYWPGEKVGDHLEFALKYDGVNLSLLASMLQPCSSERSHRVRQIQANGEMRSTDLVFL